MFPTCRGKGAPCPCPKFRKGKESKACRDCAHTKRRHCVANTAQVSAAAPSHPQDTVSSVLARQMVNHGMNANALSNLKPLMSTDKALEDVLPSYHGKCATSMTQGSGSGKSSSSKKKKQIAKSVKFQQIGSLLFLLCGMWVHTDAYNKEKVLLRNAKPPSGPEEEELCGEGIRLLVDKDATGHPLEFSPDWSTLAIDKWLRLLAPLLFQYLDATYGVRDGADDKYHWRLVRQQNKRVFLYGKELVSGADLSKCIGGQARKKETFRLHIATRQPVSKAVWMDFERAIRVAQKKPVNPNYVDAIERMPAVEDSSEEEDDSGEDSDSYVDGKVRKAIDPEAAMEEAMQTDSSSDEDAYSTLTKPAAGDKRRPPSNINPLPLFSPSPQRSPAASYQELNVNGKRRATSPPLPPVYNTRSSKRARRALVESPEPEPELDAEPEPQHELAVEESEQGEKEGGVVGVDLPPYTQAGPAAPALFIDGVDFNIPSSPDGFDYYYSPVPSPPPHPLDALDPLASTASTSSRPVRQSPGRPSKSVWKKRKTS